MNTNSKDDNFANENLNKFRKVIFQFIFFSSTFGLFSILIILNFLNSLNASKNLSNVIYSDKLTVIFGLISILFLITTHLILIPITRKMKVSQEIFGFYIVTYILGVQSIALFGFFIGFIELFTNTIIISWNYIGLFFIVAVCNGIWLYKKEIKSTLKI